MWIDYYRFSIHRSNRELFLQFVDDLNNVILFTVDSRSFRGVNKLKKSYLSGLMLSLEVKRLNIRRFKSRHTYAYKGRVRTLIESVKLCGLVF